jgi:glycosyltransferase involved in cell wall biosynthesis
MASDTLIIITARNEGDRIQATLRALARAFPTAPIWVADDGSTDATHIIAQAAGANVVRSGRPLGKGQAASLAACRALAGTSWEGAPLSDGPVVFSSVRAGEACAPEPPSKSRGPAVVLLCDADLGESAALLVPLADVVRTHQADVAVAAFATKVGGGFGVALAFARWAIRRRCGLITRAPISGQRALRAEALPSLLPFAGGFGMEIGMTIDAARAGLRVVEVELDLSHRATGKTLAGFIHRAHQLLDLMRAYLAR